MTYKITKLTQGYMVELENKTYALESYEALKKYVFEEITWRATKDVFNGTIDSISVEINITTHIK